MSRRRSKLDITLSVLSSVRDGLDKPTRIMYARAYEITEKGLNVLDYFSGAEALLDVENFT